jgi:hypothetical protein
MPWNDLGNAAPSVNPSEERLVVATPSAPIRKNAPLPFLVKKDDPARAFARVPTHAVGTIVERRCHARAALRLPLRLTHVNSVAEPIPVTLLTRNISSSGVYFLAPKALEPGMRLDLEVALVERPVGRGGVRMAAVAHVVRAEAAAEPGWHGIAATFDDMAFNRDEAVPARYREA